MKKIILAVLFIVLPFVWAEAHAWGTVLDAQNIAPILMVMKLLRHGKQRRAMLIIFGTGLL